MAELYHVSEEPAIEVFKPRFSELTGFAAVWAVDNEHLCNYLFPRDCPRVCYRAGRSTTLEDIRRFLPDEDAAVVIAVERAWFDRICASALYAYQMPPEGFELFDAIAGYFVSRFTTIPVSVKRIDSPLAELAGRSVRLQALDSLFGLRDDVVKSTLDFSCIRMRNAR